MVIKKDTGNIPYIIVYIMGAFALLAAAVFYRQPLLSVLFILIVIMAPLSTYLLRVFVKALQVNIYIRSVPLIHIPAPLTLLRRSKIRFLSLCLIVIWYINSKICIIRAIR